MFILVIMLLSTINSEPKGSNNYNIASYLLKNIRHLENESINSIADSCYVSISSISRFCRQIGLHDFNELKSQLAKYDNAVLGKFDYDQRDENDLLNSYMNRVTSNLKEVQESLDETMIDKLVADIYKYKNVYAFGYMQSAYSALNLQADLISSGKVIESNLRFPDQQTAIEQATNDDLIIIFSQSGGYFSRSYRDQRNKIRKCDAKVYMITMYENAKSIPEVDEVIRYSGNNDYASHPYPLDVIGCLISLKYSKYCNERNVF